MSAGFGGLGLILEYMPPRESLVATSGGVACFWAVQASLVVIQSYQGGGDPRLR
ncbi:unnamed protein product, partial [marine sediment metagenome]